jgi:VIT1/CCC1 family predicted Fe2+/Mn2+ transporter
MALEQRTTPNLGEQIRHTKDEAREVRGELSSIAAELRELLMMEGVLAKAEADEAKGHATKGATYGAIAGVLGFIGGIFVFLTIMFGLNEVVDLWLAALITTLIALALAAIFAMLARSQLKQFSPMPKRFMRSIKEDMQWARTQLRLNVR